MTMKDKDPRTFRERSPHFEGDVLGKSDDFKSITYNSSFSNRRTTRTDRPFSPFSSTDKQIKTRLHHWNNIFILLNLILHLNVDRK